MTDTACHYCNHDCDLHKEDSGCECSVAGCDCNLTKVVESWSVVLESTLDEAAKQRAADGLVNMLYAKYSAEHDAELDRLLEREMLFGPHAVTDAMRAPEPFKMSPLPESMQWLTEDECERQKASGGLNSIARGEPWPMDELVGKLMPDAEVESNYKRWLEAPKEPIEGGGLTREMLGIPAKPFFVPPEDCNKIVATPDGGWSITLDVQSMPSFAFSWQTPLNDPPPSVFIPNILGIEPPANDFDDTTEPSEPQKRSDDPVPAWLSSEPPEATSKVCGCTTINGITFSCLACVKGKL